MASLRSYCLEERNSIRFKVLTEFGFKSDVCMLFLCFMEYEKGNQFKQDMELTLSGTPKNANRHCMSRHRSKSFKTSYNANSNSGSESVKILLSPLV